MKQETYEQWRDPFSVPMEREFEMDGQTYLCLSIRRRDKTLPGPGGEYQLRVARSFPRAYWAQNYFTLESMPENVLAAARALVRSKPGIESDIVAFGAGASEAPS